MGNIPIKDFGESKIAFDFYASGIIPSSSTIIVLTSRTNKEQAWLLAKHLWLQTNP